MSRSFAGAGAALTAAVVAALLVSCGKSHAPPIMRPPAWIPVEFEELGRESWPPCLVQPPGGIVIDGVETYERLRRQHAPQGEYETFTADGVSRNFRLSYQPLDVDGDGVLGPTEVVIYVEDMPLYVVLGGERVQVSSRPIYVRNDSILIFALVPPYTVVRKIPYSKVFAVHPATGEVQFVPTPQAGSHIHISGVHKLYDEFGGRRCTMDASAFADRILIGMQISGDGCLRGFDKELYLDHEHHRVVYVARIKADDPSHGCPEISLQFTSWIATAKPPAGYKVEFEVTSPY